METPSKGKGKYSQVYLRTWKISMDHLTATINVLSVN